jgi:predicted DNA-binding protein
MSLLSKLFEKKNPDLHRRNGEPKTSGKLIAEIPDGGNLVEGKQTWELAENKKHDLNYMKKCCDAELNTMNKAGMVPAPYYFERVAILSRKEKYYKQEVAYCEKYIEAVEGFYKANGTEGIADVRKGPRYKAIVKRLPKAKELLEKNPNK